MPISSPGCPSISRLLPRTPSRVQPCKDSRARRARHCAGHVSRACPELVERDPAEMSCFVMRCHGGALRPPPFRALRGASVLRPVSPPVRSEGRSRSSVPPFGAKGGTGVSVLRAFRVCGRAGPRAGIAAARFVRLIARARRREGEPLRKCHEMSCDVMEAGGGRQPCGRFRRRGGSGVGCGHSCLLSGKAKGGTGVPVLRAFRVCGRAGPRAGVTRRRGSRA